MKLGLKGRTAFVTGASRGIGAAIARALASEGVNLALFGRDTARCKTLAGDLTKRHPGVRAVILSLDLEKPTTIKASITKAAKALGGCDILVNCAGIRGTVGVPVVEGDEAEWRRIFDVNTFGPFVISKRSLRT